MKVAVRVEDLGEQIEILKNCHTSFTYSINVLLKQHSNSLNHDLQIMVKYFMSQIENKDYELKQLKESLERVNLQHINQIQQLKQVLERQNLSVLYYKKVAQQNFNKFQQAMATNRKCEQQFISLMQEMQQIKGYLFQLKNMKENTQNAQPSIQIQNDELQKDQILKRIESLKNMEKRTSQALLETIKQVTEKSVHSEMQEQSEPVEEFSHVADNKTESFLCMSEVFDMNKIIFDQSRGKQNCSVSQSYVQSLNFLKNYGSSELQKTQQQPNIMESDQKTQEKEEEQQVFRLELPHIQNLRTPTLLPISIISHQEIVFENGFMYKGKTAEVNNMGYHELVPMGYGQLYYNGNLVYSGEWKNGLYEGWGKMYFSESYQIKEYRGRLCRGVLQGPGTLKFWNGCQFVGNFNNGQINGEGTFKQPNKKNRWGSWKANCLIQQS